MLIELEVEGANVVKKGVITGSGSTFILTLMLGFFPATSACAAGIDIRVNLPDCTMTITQDHRALTSFPVRIGSRDMPTPTGTGRIAEKRKRVVFRYLQGDNKDEIIRRSHIRPTGETIDMPYDRLRGLDMVFDNGNQVLTIHSTTEYWTIGFPVSHSCIGMNIDDMLKLFDLLVDLPIRIAVTYDTVEVQGNTLFFYPDVYGRATNRLSEVMALGVPVSDTASAQNRVTMIDRTLRFNLNKSLAEVNAGHDARALRNRLVMAVPVNEFLAPFHPKARIVDITVQDNDSFGAALARGGLSTVMAAALSNAITGLDYRRLHPGDSLALTIEDSEVVNLDYTGYQGNKTFSLKNIFVRQK